MTPPDLRGRLVRLRAITADDRDRIVAIRRSPEVARWWRGDDLGAEFDADLADDSLHQFAIEVLAIEPLAIEPLDGDPLAPGDEVDPVVGLIQFAEEDDPDYRHASIDLFLDPAVHRRGLASDAIRTLADHLFDERGHHRLVIDPSVDNEAAIACYQRVGFRPVGVMRAYERRADGSWSDGLLLDLLASDRGDPSGG